MCVPVYNILSIGAASARLVECPVRQHALSNLGMIKPMRSALVLWELLISIFCSATSVYFVWMYLVDNYFNPGFMVSAPWPLGAVPMLSVLYVEHFSADHISRIV
jgi:hypothetical protein